MEQQNASNKKKSQSSKFKVFEMSRKYFAIIGITPSLVHQSCPFNGTILFEFLLFGAAIYGTFAFLIYDAETFAEYTQSVYTSSVVIFVILGLLILMLKIEKLFALLNGCDVLANTSE